MNPLQRLRAGALAGRLTLGLLSATVALTSLLAPAASAAPIDRVPAAETVGQNVASEIAKYTDLAIEYEGMTTCANVPSCIGYPHTEYYYFRVTNKGLTTVSGAAWSGVARKNHYGTPWDYLGDIHQNGLLATLKPGEHTLQHFKCQLPGDVICGQVQMTVSHPKDAKQSNNIAELVLVTN